MNQSHARARLQFLSWVRKNFPDLYQAAVEAADEGEALGQVGPPAPAAAEKPSFWNRVGGALTSLGTTYLTLRNQRDAMKLNLERAKQGLPPVDAGVTAPVVRTQIDLPPDVVAKVTQSAGTEINKILLFGGVALAALLLMRK